MKRYEKFVLEAEKGITFEVSEGTSGELIIKSRHILPNNARIEFPIVSAEQLIIRDMSIAPNNLSSEFPTVSAGEYAEVLSVYTDKNGNKAIVPPEWTVSGVPKENIIWGKDKGLVIYHIPKEKVSGINWQNSGEVETLMRTYDQFVWTPVGLLTANAMFDGIHFNEKFGIMNYLNDWTLVREYNKTLVSELLLQKKSVDKYEGYYSSRYNISKDEETGKPRSVYGADPWTRLNYFSAEKVVSTMVESKTVTTHLMYEAEYDTRDKWAIESGTVTIEEIVNDSTKFGNYANNKNYPYKIVRTGEDGCINNIYGFAGNVVEWIKKSKKSSSPFVRGGCFVDEGDKCPVAKCDYTVFPFYSLTGFRSALYIK